MWTYFSFKTFISHELYICMCICMYQINYKCVGRHQHYLLGNFHTKHKAIIGIRSFRNKSLENIFGLVFLIIVFKMSLKLLFSFKTQINTSQLSFLRISRPTFSLEAVTWGKWCDVWLCGQKQRDGVGKLASLPHLTGTPLQEWFDVTEIFRK